jgi:predicted alpha/beta superfamily hydrolase
LLGDGPHGGEGAAYVDWLADVLKPFIDQTYPTDPGRTWIAGSSMGGLISLYAACRRPETFSRIGAFSPAVWFAESELLACLSSSFPKETGAYVDIGTQETSDADNPRFPAIYLDGARHVFDVLRKRGVENLLYVEDEGAIHHESAWERRFPMFLRWLLESKS